MARQGTIVETFRGIFRPFRCQKIPIAPNQHPTLAARLEKSGSTAPSPLPVRRFHIHSKTACRGASACRWHASYEPTEPAGETSPSLHFRHAMGELSPLSLLCSVLSHPASSASNRCYPLQHPERTRFAFFGLFPGAFRSFCPLLTRKICGLIFVHPAA